jgi:hypothetical protein
MARMTASQARRVAAKAVELTELYPTMLDWPTSQTLEVACEALGFPRANAASVWAYVLANQADTGASGASQDVQARPSRGAS